MVFGPPPLFHRHTCHLQSKPLPHYSQTHAHTKRKDAVHILHSITTRVPHHREILKLNRNALIINKQFLLIKQLFIRKVHSLHHFFQVPEHLPRMNPFLISKQQYSPKVRLPHAQKRQKTPTQHPSQLTETHQNPSKLKYFKLFCTNACTIQQKDLTLHSQNNDGAIAQLVEQRTENPCVPGSIPGGTTKKQSSYPKVTAFFIPPPQKKHT